MTYEELLEQADSESLIVREKNIPGYGGRIYKNRIAIHKDMTATQKACILAEELGHHYTTIGDILDQSTATNRKQERRARIWAYNKQIGLRGLINAYQHGCQSLSEAADYLEVTEQFLVDAINCYKSIYGIYTTVDNYIIYFQPSLAVGKLTYDK